MDGSRGGVGVTVQVQFFGLRFAGVEGVVGYEGDLVRFVFFDWRALRDEPGHDIYAVTVVFFAPVSVKELMLVVWFWRGEGVEVGLKLTSCCPYESPDQIRH